jgi:carboxymethylenebutenolidase
MSVETAVPYFTAKPSGPTEGRAGLVVVMEGNGISQQLLRVCQRFAAEGFVVAAPDLFHRFGGSDADRAAADGWYGKLRPEDGLADVAAAAAELRSVGVASVGITGFCMGGLFSYLAATRGVDVQACVPFYGGRIGENLGDPSCPMLAFFGGNDPYIPTSEIDAVVARHGDAVVVYDDADHGFMRDGSPSYHPTAAPDAWQRALTFLRANLPGAATGSAE